MKHYLVLVENDISEWNEGSSFVYYKGRIRDKSYGGKRISSEPHYFGAGSIGNVVRDKESEKKYFYAEIIDYKPFSLPVHFKNDGRYVELIPDNRK